MSGHSKWSEIKRQKGAPANDLERTRARAAAEVGMQTIGLAVLLARAGGSVTFDVAEHTALLERYGGRTNMTIHMEILKGPGEKRSLRFTLARKAPGNAELVT